MRRLPLVLLAVLVLAGCGDTPGAQEAPATGWTTYRDDRHGITVSFPSDWQRARSTLTPTLLQPREVLSVGTFPLRARDSACGHLPTGALEAMGPADVFVTLQEARGSARGFPVRPAPFDLGDDRSEIAACLGRGTPFTDHWIMFRDRGRAFYVLAAVGTDASPEDRQAVLEVLGGLRIDPTRRTSVGWARIDLRPGWRAVRRPLTGDRTAVTLATFAVPAAPPDPDCRPAALLDAAPPGGAWIHAFEYRGLNARQLDRFPERPRRFRRAPERGYECFGGSGLYRWREGRRAFQAHVHARGARLREALGMLDSLVVRSRG